MPVVMGTAGHIDHGKTSLVRALTGTNCDRLVEEKKRGITIELGFAFLKLPDESLISIIDVPGHEKFIKNMVAGTAGIDFVMLVVAADEGVMPQTREHLEICNLLGIKRGLVALTKTDMVDKDWLELVKEDVRSFLKGSFLEEASIYPVSSQTGEGLDEIRSVLIQMSKDYSPARRGDLPRLPVDRIFTIKGYGTVVTGTLVSGALSVGDSLTLMPSGKVSKVRMLQSHGHSVEKAPMGYRTSVNLPMLEVADIEKGDVLTQMGRLFPSDRWVLKVNCLSSSPRPLRHRMEIHFHHEAKEVQARIYFLDREKLNPGESALCVIHFDTPMVGVFADHFVMRSFSPLRTVAGGSIIHPLPLILKKRDKAYPKKLSLLSKLADRIDTMDISESILTQLELSGDTGATFYEVCVLVNHESSKIEKSLQTLTSKQEVFLIDKEERRYISKQSISTASEACLKWFEAFHKKEPLKTGPTRNEVASAWGRNLNPKLVFFILKRLLDEGRLSQEGDLLRLLNHSISLDGATGKQRNKIIEIYTKDDMEPRNFKDVLAELNVTLKQIMPLMKVLTDSKELVKVSDDFYFTSSAMKKITDKLLKWFESNKEVGPAEFRDITGLSRKYGIALLEFFDKIKLTVRAGDKRILVDATKANFS